MKVRELIELLQNKPLDLDVYLQEVAPTSCKAAPGVIRLSMATLFDKYVAVMDNAGVRYLAIGCTTSGVADADDSKATNVDDEYKNTEPAGSLENVASEKAREYALNMPGGERATAVGKTYSESGYYQGFVAGSYWQMSKDGKILHNVICQSHEAGRIYERETSKNKAVDGVICGKVRREEDGPYELHAESDSLPLDGKFKMGDKVKLLILPSNETE